MRYKLTVAIILGAAQLCGAQNALRDFESFRDSLFSGYHRYRQGILADYESFLRDTWHDYQIFKAPDSNNIPKPDRQPSMPENATMPDTQIPAPAPEQPPLPESQPERPDEPEALPNMPPLGVRMTSVDFFGTNINLPLIDIHPISNTSNNNVANYWRDLNDNASAQSAIDLLKNAIRKYDLNDWLAFKLAQAYAETLFPARQASDTRIAIIQYLLCNIGYDIRLALYDDGLTLLMPFTTTIYARSYLELDGKRFSIFFDSASAAKTITGTIQTYSLPYDKNTGYSFNPIFSQPPMLVEKPEDFRLSGAGITITGKADANLREILSDYPQLPVVDYTKSELQPELRNDIARQLKMQVAEMDEMRAVNTLLHFVQKAFNYQTDDKQFGFEKPLFPEESILYKRNDCEDRAIFFGMLIRNVLNLECLLVEYPGHIGTAVCLSDSSATGTYYMVDGKKYFVADPTFEGADAGMCMPDFRNINPKVYRFD